MAGEGAGILEKITANIELTELKKFKVQKAILTLMLEWKHLEEYMDSTQHSFQECLDDLQRKEDHLNSVQKSANQSNKHLESVRVSLEDRMKLLDDKESQLFVFRDQIVNELDFREQQLGLMGKSLEERVKEVELREDKVKLVFEEYQESIGRIVEKRMEELDDKEREFSLFRDKQVKELGFRDEELEGRIKQVESREDKVKVIFEKFKAKEKIFEDIRHSVWERIDWIGRRGKELDAKEKDFERRVKELDAKERDFDKNRKELEYKEKELIVPVRKIESMGKEISNVALTNVKMELQLEDNRVNSSTGIYFFAKMDGKGLQSFLNKREKDHHLMAEEVYRGLQLSSDPAKLVLDAMEGFYCHPNKRNREFQLNVTRKSCILLLGQLQRISPQVSSQVKEEAMKLIWQWKAKLPPVPNFMEVLGHLYLLASYRLPIPFDTDELLGLFEIVADHRQAPELCRILGFTDHVTGLIRNLLRKNHILAAVRFISEFGHVDEFSPELLLKDYVKQLKINSKKMLRSNNSRTSQHAVINKRVAALRKVIRCIIDNKLESMYSPKIIEQSIEHLLRVKGDNKGSAPPPSSKPVEREKSRMESMSLINSLVVSNPPSTSPSSSKPVATELVPVTDMAFLLANMDGERLQFFLNLHFEDHELMRNEVLRALQHSLDPARLVLNAIQGFYLPYRKVGDEHFEPNVIRGSCILLLEQLMRLQGHFHHVEGEVIEIFHQWILKMKDEIENFQVILGFLQFLAAFRLTSHFQTDELLCLFEKIAPHPHARELCELLGFAEKNPGCVLHPRITDGSVLENVSLDKAVDFVNVSPEHDLNSMGVNMEGKNEVPIFLYASDPAKLVLDAIRGCYHSIMEKGPNCPKAKSMDKISSLLEQLMGASPQIKSQVQEQATAFSNEWKSKLSVSRKNQAEVKAFLHLLATYKLPSSVMYKVLHDLLKTVPDYKQKFELYRHLNFAHKTPDYIQYLIENDERLVAIRFIYKFMLVEKFPPVPILKSHLRYIEKLCKKICEEGDYSPEALDKAADKEIALLRSVIKCLIIHRIKCDCTPENLQVVIDHIQKQKEDRKMKLPTGGSRGQKKKPGMKKRAAYLEGEPHEQQDAIKRPRLTPPPITAAQSSYPVNQTKEQAPYPIGHPIGQNRHHQLTWHYDSYGGSMAPLEWQYGPDAGGAYPNNMMIPRPPPLPQGPTPHLYPPREQP